MEHKLVFLTQEEEKKEKAEKADRPAHKTSGSLRAFPLSLSPTCSHFIVLLNELFHTVECLFPLLLKHELPYLFFLFGYAPCRINLIINIWLVNSSNLGRGGCSRPETHHSSEQILENGRGTVCLTDV